MVFFGLASPLWTVTQPPSSDLIFIPVTTLSSSTTARGLAHSNGLLVGSPPPLLDPVESRRLPEAQGYSSPFQSRQDSLPCLLTALQLLSWRHLRSAAGLHLQSHTFPPALALETCSTFILGAHTPHPPLIASPQRSTPYHAPNCSLLVSVDLLLFSSTPV